MFDPDFAEQMDRLRARYAGGAEGRDEWPLLEAQKSFVEQWLGILEKQAHGSEGGGPFQDWMRLWMSAGLNLINFQKKAYAQSLQEQIAYLRDYLKLLEGQLQRYKDGEKNQASHGTGSPSAGH